MVVFVFCFCFFLSLYVCVDIMWVLKHIYIDPCISNVFASLPIAAKKSSNKHSPLLHFDRVNVDAVDVDQGLAQNPPRERVVIGRDVSPLQDGVVELPQVLRANHVRVGVAGLEVDFSGGTKEQRENRLLVKIPEG